MKPVELKMETLVVWVVTPFIEVMPEMVTPMFPTETKELAVMLMTLEEDVHTPSVTPDHPEHARLDLPKS